MGEVNRREKEKDEGEIQEKERQRWMEKHLLCLGELGRCGRLALDGGLQLRAQVVHLLHLRLHRLQLLLARRGHLFELGHPRPQRAQLVVFGNALQMQR